MGHYRANIRDVEFNLFEFLRVQQVFGSGRFADLDEQIARDMLAEMARLAEGPLADSFADGDRNPPVFDPNTHTVSLPESFKKSVRAYQHGDWYRIGHDVELGGTPMPSALV